MCRYTANRKSSLFAEHSSPHKKTGIRPSLLSDEFKSLLDKTCRYRNAKMLGDNHRESRMLSKQDEAEEKVSRLDFAEAYKTFWEKHNAAA
jgi:hypothetical protein